MSDYGNYRSCETFFGKEPPHSLHNSYHALASPKRRRVYFWTKTPRNIQHYYVGWRILGAVVQNKVTFPHHGTSPSTGSSCVPPIIFLPIIFLPPFFFSWKSDVQVFQGSDGAQPFLRASVCAVEVFFPVAQFVLCRRTAQATSKRLGHFIHHILRRESCNHTYAWADSSQLSPAKYMLLGLSPFLTDAFYAFQSKSNQQLILTNAINDFKRLLCASANKQWPTISYSCVTCPYNHKSNKPYYR